MTENSECFLRRNTGCLHVQLRYFFSVLCNNLIMRYRHSNHVLSVQLAMPAFKIVLRSNKTSLYISVKRLFSASFHKY